jgi:tRNA A-37 threonylcarbamoyl transferase component Bud32
MKKNKRDVKFLDTYYEKVMTKNEIQITSMLYNQSILPEFEIKNDILKVEAFPMTLGTYIKQNLIKNESELEDIPDKINQLIRKLHHIGIVHIDLHTENIVINDTNKKDILVRFIDFEFARKIDDLCEEDILDFQSFLPNFYPRQDTFENSIEDLLSYEYEMWKYDYFL